MRKSFRTRLFLSFFLVMVAAMALPSLWTRANIRSKLIAEAEQQALGEAYQIRGMLTVTTWDARTLQNVVYALGGGLTQRLTLVNSEGEVVADSSVHPMSISTLDIHSADRLEIRQAKEHGSGVAIRSSRTLGQEVVFAAVRLTPDTFPPPLDKGGVLRIAMPVSSVQAYLDRILDHWIPVSSVVLLLAMVLSFLLARRIEAPIHEMIVVIGRIATGEARGARLHILPGKEFKQMADAVNDMADRIEASIQTIESQRAQMATILRTMREGLMVLDTEGRISMVNDMLMRFLPQTASSIGRRPIEVVPSEELQSAFEAMVVHSDNEAGSSTLRIEPRRDLALSVHIVRARHSRPDVAVVAVFHDITELSRLMQMRRDFVANVSHELRTPLTSIHGYAETLAGLPPEEEAMRERCLKTIMRQTEHMEHLVGDLLLIARLENSALPLDVERLQLAELAASVAVNLEPQAEAGNLRIEISIDSGLYVMADRHFLGQVFRNLLENACRYGAPGTPIEVTAVATDKEVIVSVRDHGPGIEPDALGRIFERFYRASRSRGKSSTGLGLAICKHVVERHGGRIWAENTPGAALRFSLPLIVE